MLIAGQNIPWDRVANVMREPREEVVVPNLIEVLNKLDDDLDRIELWTAALSCFQHPAPEYQPDNDYRLPVKLDAHY